MLRPCSSGRHTQCVLFDGRNCHGSKPLTNDIAIEAARDQDLGDVLALLTQQRLPLEGLADPLATTLVAPQSGRVVGSAARETYRDGVLLRSVAVSPDLQGQGLGRTLTGAAIQLARDRRAAAVYLLTTTAEDYFPRLGFERIARGDVPASVQESVEFRSACPSAAVVMRKI